MAWVRTSTSMIAFGFGIYQFLQYLSTKEQLREPAHPACDLQYQGTQRRGKQCHGERHQRGAAQLRQHQQGAISLAESRYTPGEPTEGDARLQPFLQRPHRGHPQRPGR